MKFEWLDMDAYYYALEDPKRTPLQIKWIKEGTVRLESESMSHVVVCGLKNMNEYVSIIK